MGSGDEVVEIESLEKRLLSESEIRPHSGEETEAEDETVVYTASFEETEEKFIKYQTAQWVLYSLLLILAWGIGLFMLLYLPVRRYILRKDVRSRKLYLTPNAIVYKVNYHHWVEHRLLIAFVNAFCYFSSGYKTSAIPMFWCVKEGEACFVAFGC